LQQFLKACLWDHAGLTDAVQQTVRAAVADMPADPVGTVAILDETSAVKKGAKTPGVQRLRFGLVPPDFDPDPFGPPVSSSPIDRLGEDLLVHLLVCAHLTGGHGLQSDNGLLPVMLAGDIVEYCIVRRAHAGISHSPECIALLRPSQIVEVCEEMITRTFPWVKEKARPV
jgi:hypothetical protein